MKTEKFVQKLAVLRPTWKEEHDCRWLRVIDERTLIAAIVRRVWESTITSFQQVFRQCEMLCVRTLTARPIHSLSVMHNARVMVARVRLSALLSTISFRESIANRRNVSVTRANLFVLRSLCFHPFVRFLFLFELRKITCACNSLILRDDTIQLIDHAIDCTFDVHLRACMSTCSVACIQKSVRKMKHFCTWLVSIDQSMIFERAKPKNGRKRMKQKSRIQTTIDVRNSTRITECLRARPYTCTIAQYGSAECDFYVHWISKCSRLCAFLFRRCDFDANFHIMIGQNPFNFFLSLFSWFEFRSKCSRVTHSIDANGEGNSIDGKL